ncbi:MAG: hypothetical protein KKB70_02090 [Proteobacteria bacterium]|nr:hypothetical protein [Pseudomonadota bacterium]
MTDNIPRAESVLLVDDEAGIRTVLGITLEDKGYRVFTAASGQEALEQFEAHPPPSCSRTSRCPAWTASPCSGRSRTVDRKPR